MKRRDFVKLGALSPVVPAMLVAKRPERPMIVTGSHSFTYSFKDAESQTRCIKTHFARHRGLWKWTLSDWPAEYHIIKDVNSWQRGTAIQVNACLFVARTGSTITVSGNSINIVPCGPPYAGWTWAPETYGETVIREAAKFNVYRPEHLLPIAIDRGIEQKDIGSWLRWRYGPRHGLVF